MKRNLPREMHHDPAAQARGWEEVAGRRRRLYASAPLEAVVDYLECFNEEGSQARSIPQETLEAIARVFRQAYGRVGRRDPPASIDLAFGGCVARGLHQISRRRGRDADILFDLMIRRGNRPSAKASGYIGTTFDQAVAAVAAKHNVGEENVRRIWKKSKPLPAP